MVGHIGVGVAKLQLNMATVTLKAQADALVAG
jgi:hypothetical protein